MDELSGKLGGDFGDFVCEIGWNRHTSIVVHILTRSHAHAHAGFPLRDSIRRDRFMVNKLWELGSASSTHVYVCTT